MPGRRRPEVKRPPAGGYRLRERFSINPNVPPRRADCLFEGSAVAVAPAGNLPSGAMQDHAKFL
jgi:hypothetical protein